MGRKSQDECTHEGLIERGEVAGGLEGYCPSCGWRPNTRYFTMSTWDIILAAFKGDKHARAECLRNKDEVNREIESRKPKTFGASWDEFWNSPDRPRKF